MPSVTRHPTVLALIAVGVAAAAVSVLARRTQRRRGVTGETPPSVRGRLQSLPPLRIAVGIVAVVALLLGFRSIVLGHEPKPQPPTARPEQSRHS